MIMDSKSMAHKRHWYKHIFVSLCIVHHLSTFRRCEVTSLVVLQYSHVRVDPMRAHRAAVDEPPAEVVVHVHARCGIDHRLVRVASANSIVQFRKCRVTAVVRRLSVLC